MAGAYNFSRTQSFIYPENTTTSGGGTVNAAQNGASLFDPQTVEWGTNSLLHNTVIPQNAFDIEFAGGTFWSNGNVGAVPAAAAGAGTRMMWIPSLQAFRAGDVTGTQWDAANIGANSVAFGEDNEASGLFSFAHGRFNVEAGLASATFGVANSNVANTSLLQGSTISVNSGATVLAVAEDAVIDSFRSVVFGRTHVLSSNESFVHGTGHNVSGTTLQFVFGNANTLAGGSSNYMFCELSTIDGAGNNNFLSGSAITDTGLISNSFIFAHTANITGDNNKIFADEVLMGSSTEAVALGQSINFTSVTRAFIFGTGNNGPTLAADYLNNPKNNSLIIGFNDTAALGVQTQGDFFIEENGVGIGNYDAVVNTTALFNILPNKAEKDNAAIRAQMNWAPSALTPTVVNDGNMYMDLVGRFQVEADGTSEILAYLSDITGGGTPTNVSGYNAGLSGNIVLAGTGLDNLITIDSVAGGFNVGSDFNTGTNTYTAPITGFYLLGGQISASFSSGGQLTAILKVNGTTISESGNITGNPSLVTASISDYADLTAGDTVQLFGRNDSGFAANVFVNFTGFAGTLLQEP